LTDKDHLYIVRSHSGTLTKHFSVKVAP
jgi:hypothetical protein